jgi:hypothetical protein
MEMKYELTDITCRYKDRTLYRIRSLRDFTLINGKEIKAGDLGGWVESSDNLSQWDKCWVYDECKMYENAHRLDDSIGYNNSEQFGHSRQFGFSQQFGCSQQFDYSMQFGVSKQFDNSRQLGFSQQFDCSQQFGCSQQSDLSHQGGYCLDNGTDIVPLTFTPPTPGHLVTIGQDGMIHSVYFSGTSFYLIDKEKRGVDIPLWAYGLHAAMITGKVKEFVEKMNCIG